MTIDWAHFTPWASLSGGILLGVASALFILLNGRVLGISGILGGLILPRPGDRVWRIAFLLGMASAPFVFSWLIPADMRQAPHVGTPPRRASTRATGWSSSPGCWSVWAPATDPAAPAGTACAACRACRRVRWSPP